MNAVGDLQGGIEEAERMMGYTSSPTATRCRRRRAGSPVPILKQGHYLIASIQSALTDADLLELRDDLSSRSGGSGRTA